jgi:hypothetical protein
VRGRYSRARALHSALFILSLATAAREDVYGVCVGGILGHALCTGLAVLGGRFIATRISVRTVTLVGIDCFLNNLFIDCVFPGPWLSVITERIVTLVGIGYFLNFVHLYRLRFPGYLLSVITVRTVMLVGID